MGSTADKLLDGDEAPSVADVARGRAKVQEKKRTALFFTIDKGEFPPEEGVDHDIEISMVSPTPDEEIEAGKVCDGELRKFNFELAKAVMRTWDGKRIDHGEGEAEEKWHVLGPKGRNVVMAAFNHLWQASPGAVEKLKLSFRWGKVA